MIAQDIIGVDIAKDWIDTFQLSSGRHEHIATTKQTLARFAKGAKGALVVLEASGGYERVLIEALTRFKVDFVRVNPRHAREFARSTGKLAKTDRVDAALLARMGRALELQPTPPAPPRQVDLQDLVARRDDLVGMIGAERNRLAQCRHGAAKGAALAMVRAEIASHITVLVRHRAATEARIATLIAADPALAETARLLQSVPGIGPAIAATILARLPEIGTLDRRKLASLAGLAPQACDSGLARGKRRVWGGRPSLTRALYLAAFIASRHDPNVKAFRAKLQAAGKPVKVAIIACARRLLTTLAAMIRDRKEYSPA